MTRDPKAITIWPFCDAPPEYQKLCNQGGDEDWIAFIPSAIHNQDPSFLWEGSNFGCCSVDRVAIPEGTLVVGCHA